MLAFSADQISRSPIPASPSHSEPMFGGYHSGEESSPEPEGFDQNCINIGVLEKGTTENCTEKNDIFDTVFHESPSGYIHKPIVVPATDISIHKITSQFTTCRIRNDGYINFRSNLHSPHTNRGDMLQAFFPENRSGLPKIRPKKSENAWMSLDGLLVDADYVTLRTEEYCLWNRFIPLQRALIVAVAVAAAFALSQKDNKKIKSLEIALQDRDRECKLLHEKIRQLQGHLSFWKEHVIPFCGSHSGSTTDHNLGMNEATPKCDSVILEQFATPQVLLKSETNAAGFNKKYSRFNSYMSNGGELIPCYNHANHSQSNPNSLERGQFLERLLEFPSISATNEQLDGSLTPSLPLAKLNEMDTPQCHSSGFPLNKYGEHLCGEGRSNEALYADIISPTNRQSMETPFFLEDPVDSNGFSMIRVTEQTLEDEIDRSIQGESDLRDSGDVKQESSRLDTETDVWNEALEDVNKTLSLCIDDCHAKEIKISRLQEEINVLQGIISDLRTLQVNQVTGQVDASSLQTFVTSNVLYNVELSPVEVADSPEMPKCVLSPWKELTRLTDSFELSITRDSLENEHNSYADVESCKSQSSPDELLIGRNKERRRAHISYCDMVSSFDHVSFSDAGKKYGYPEVKSSKSEDVMSDCDPKESGVDNMLGQNSVFESSKTNGDTDHVRWSNSSIEQATRLRTSNSSQEESLKGSNIARYGHSQKYADRHNMVFTSPTRPTRRPRINSSVRSSYSYSERVDNSNDNLKATGRHNNDSEQIEDNSTHRNNMVFTSPTRPTRRPRTNSSVSSSYSYSERLEDSNDNHIVTGRHNNDSEQIEENSTLRGGKKRNDRDLIKGSNVLSGVEPNTTSPKRDGKCVSKNKVLSNSLDGLNKAKENRGQRKRWM